MLWDAVRKIRRYVTNSRRTRVCRLLQCAYSRKNTIMSNTFPVSGCFIALGYRETRYGAEGLIQEWQNTADAAVQMKYVVNNIDFNLIFPQNGRSKVRTILKRTPSRNVIIQDNSVQMSTSVTLAHARLAPTQVRNHGA